MTITLPAAAREPDHTISDGLPAARRRWAIAAIFTALAMASLDTAIANIALPAIAADLHVTPEQSVWVVKTSIRSRWWRRCCRSGRSARSSGTSASISAA
ncbi:MFS family permease [Bradyrhizobium sp. LM6.10]